MNLFIGWIAPEPGRIQGRVAATAYCRVLRDHGITCGTTHMDRSDRLHVGAIDRRLPNTNLG
jgi:hypothetical protein